MEVIFNETKRDTERERERGKALNMLMIRDIRKVMPKKAIDWE